MSETSYSSTTVVATLNVRERLGARVAARLRALLEDEPLPSSIALSDALRATWEPLPAQADEEVLVARIERLAKVGGIAGTSRSAFDALAPEMLTAATESANAAKAMLSRGRIEAAASILSEAEQHLTSSRDGAISLLERAERETVSDALVNALSEAGWSAVRKATVGGATGVIASRGPAIFAAQVLDGGGLTHGMAGLEGTTCLIESERVFARMARFGVMVQQVTQRFHGEEPDAMILNASQWRARHGGSLEQALAETAIAGSCSVVGSSKPTVHAAARTSEQSR